MGSLAFRIDMVLSDLHGFEGVCLIGPKVEHGNLAVGERVQVPTKTGIADAVCTGFPLIRLDGDKIDWVRVTVAGVDADTVLVGGVAHG